MLKVFLVEDEYVVRNGIKNNIDWAREGFEFCGDAGDGEIGYKLIKSKQPDIIITDIRMPFMDGLELSHLVKKEFPQSKIIILSGHEEFTYAQKAIKIGVDEYILKPINSNDLLEVVKRVGNQIINERIEIENMKQYQIEMQENEIYIKNRFFDKIIKGTLSTAAILEKGKIYGFEMSAQYYQIILLKYNIKGKDENYSSELLKLDKEISGLNSKYTNIIFFERVVEGNVLLVKANSLEVLEETRKAYLSQVKEVLERYEEVTYFGGVGLAVSRLTNLSESYESAALAFARRFIINRNDIVASDETSELIYKENNLLINTLDLENLDTKMVEEFLKQGELSEIDFFVEEFLKHISEISKESLLLRQYVIMNVYLTALDFLKEIGEKKVLAEELTVETDEIKEMVVDLEKFKVFISNVFAVCIKRRDLLKVKHYYCVVDKAKQYLSEHYKNENISLNQVAAHVNISPSYFSTVFRKETGIGFIKYLTGLRMDKAKELLKFTDLRCSEISNQIGYKDPQYFSYIFKKEHDCTPIQYRDSKR